MAAGEYAAFAGKRSPEDRQRLIAARDAIAAGQEISDDLVTDEDAEQGFALVAKLIIGWHVYDPADMSDNPEPLPMPATSALVAKLPQEILVRIMGEVNQANPPQTPADGTGKTS